MERVVFSVETPHVIYREIFMLIIITYTQQQIFTHRIKTMYTQNIK